MANTNYTGSPLGIIHSEKLTYDVNGNVINSIFSSSTQMNRNETGGILKTRRKGNNFLSQHNDEIYDLSTPYIIDKLESIPALSLKYSDFAYLKNYGVYPNNRLVVIRRFETPVGDDLFAIEGLKKPMSTIVGYVEDIGKLIETKVSEEWENSKSSLTSLLNEFGDDVAATGMKSNAHGSNKDKLGDYAAAGANILPKQFLNPFTQVLQRKILQGMGLISETDASVLPFADPNIIRESKQRKIPGDGDSSGGLKGVFKVTLTTEYEQKFINGVDPTIVYMDIINNALQMGTSKSTFYLGRGDGMSQKAQNIINRLSTDPIGELRKWAEAITKSMKDALSQLTETLFGTKKEDTQQDEDNEERAKRIQREKEKAERDENNQKVDQGTNLINDFTNQIKTGINAIIQNIILKYRHQLLGVITNMTGAASTPWHVTIGNPLRPIFMSGDMLCEDVKIEPGNVLAFNNLPNTIKVTITLESARNLGMQEIFAKYNAGSIRTINGTYVSTGPEDFYAANNYVYNKPTTKPISKNSPVESPQGPEFDKNNPNTTTQTTKATTSGTQKVNNDANGDSIIPATENTGGISNSSTTETIQPITSGPNARVIKT